jgi:hypothetical protein
MSFQSPLLESIRGSAAREPSRAHETANQVGGTPGRPARQNSEYGRRRTPARRRASPLPVTRIPACGGPIWNSSVRRTSRRHSGRLWAVAGLGNARALPWLAGASACLYAGGVVLNDFFDRKVDVVERPERPLPSGRVPPAHAAWLGSVLLSLGILSAGMATPAAGSSQPPLPRASCCDTWGKRRQCSDPSTWASAGPEPPAGHGRRSGECWGPTGRSASSDGLHRGRDGRQPW